MILGLDTQGSVYLSLLQANNNAQTMGLFFQRLTRKLDKERPSWRKDTVILLDNAAYHKSPTILNVFEKLRIPIIYSGATATMPLPASCTLLLLRKQTSIRDGFKPERGKFLSFLTVL